MASSAKAPAKKGVEPGKRYPLEEDFCKAIQHPTKGQRLYFDSNPKAPSGLALRVSPGAKSWVLCYIADRTQRRMTIGRFPNMTPANARREASKLRDAVNARRDPLAEQRAERAERERTAAAKRAAEHRTLAALLTAYCDHLRAQGRPSAHDVQGLIHLHVRDAHPKLWDAPAAELKAEDGRTILANLKRVGKLRTAGKVRAALRAAYSLAIKARLDSGLSDALAELNITGNPMRDLPVSDGYMGKRRDRYLRDNELRSYWKRIAALPGPDGALLRFHLATGGQRVEQLSRLTAADLDGDTVTLRDGKGRRKLGEPRLHVVPLTEAALDALKAMRGTGRHLFSLDGGRTPADYFALNHRLAKVVAAMTAAEELEHGTFTVGDLRRTVETLLASKRVPKHVRAQLQSHGITGVQSAHYDRHEYLDEKREALTVLHKLATGKVKTEAATVTPIRRARKGAK